MAVRVLVAGWKGLRSVITSGSVNSHLEKARPGQTEAALVFPERFVRCQSIRQRPPAEATDINAVRCRLVGMLPN